PIVQKEKLAVSTDAAYLPGKSYSLVKYNLSTEEISSEQAEASDQGKLDFQLSGGGHLVGIDENAAAIPNLKMVFKNNPEYFYFEVGKKYALDFNLVNVGTGRAENVEISAFSTDPAVNFVEKGLRVPKVDQGDFLTLENRLEFSVGHFN